MKKYEHGSGRKRFMGYSTGDKDVSIAYFYGDKIVDETTHMHTASDEVYIAISGTIWVDGKIYRLQPSKPLRVEKSERHRMLSIHKAPLKMYVVKVPDDSDDKHDVETHPHLAALMRKHGLL